MSNAYVDTETGYMVFPNLKKKPKYDQLFGELHGYIYLFECLLSGLYKIGYAQDVDRRFKEIYIPRIGLSIKHMFLTEDMRKTERRIHKLYKFKRIEGEWFNLSENDISIFCSYEDYQFD